MNAPTSTDLTLPVTGHSLPGTLAVPEQAAGLVVFAHGSGSGRSSPRNRYVAGLLHHAGLATLLFDLLTEDEEADRGNVFDIELLAGRLSEVLTWRRTRPDVADLALGLFGASTGAAAALWAAADDDLGVHAVVSRGGRPDLAATRLPGVRAATLLIVGGLDTAVLALNADAAEQLGGEHALAVVPGATHLFEEPGTLHQAGELARDWLLRHLSPTG
ncbi:dienelactone hydrolase family protein [Catellatospora sp. TT07R-123]|uniref:dienelactone hydrolase family protein n=1 Tax=Catellatospora sp. TT07R-123 TaxID=2733863 RepID=UPI001FCFC729|nr:hydrolase [Catellatospora sp. TT07R-123]